MYIGRDVDNISNVEKLDNITFSGTTTYALTKSSVAYTPSGANNILISIDGVVQQGNFSISGQNIVMDWSPTSSNTCDWILHFGTGLITTPADGTVTLAKMAVNSIDSDQYVDASIDNAHLADDAVGVAELSATGTASSSTFLRGDNAWAAAGGGKVLQVVRETNSTTASSTSATFADVFTTTITPASSSNYIFALCTYNWQMYGHGGDNEIEGTLRIADGSDVTKSQQQFLYGDSDTVNGLFKGGGAISAYWAAGGTSEITVKLTFAELGTGRFLIYGDDSSTNATAFTIMEIEA